jgi:hypothetical protein
MAMVLKMEKMHVQMKRALESLMVALTLMVMELQIHKTSVLVKLVQLIMLDVQTQLLRLLKS